MSIETHVLDVIREQLSRRQPVDGGSRNVVRTMIATCGYAEVRSLAAQRLEMWLQNPKVLAPMCFDDILSCAMYFVALLDICPQVQLLAIQLSFSDLSSFAHRIGMPL